MQEPFNPGVISADSSHSCGAYHPCEGRGVLAATEVVAAIEAEEGEDGTISGAALRKHLGLPARGTLVIGVHVDFFGVPLDAPLSEAA